MYKVTHCRRVGVRMETVATFIQHFARNEFSVTRERKSASNLKKVWLYAHLNPLVLSSKFGHRKKFPTRLRRRQLKIGRRYLYNFHGMGRYKAFFIYRPWHRAGNFMKSMFPFFHGYNSDIMRTYANIISNTRIWWWFEKMIGDTDPHKYLKKMVSSIKSVW